MVLNGTALRLVLAGGSNDTGKEPGAGSAPSVRLEGDLDAERGVAMDQPFGGVGASGMGAYHGIEGFRSLSHAKGIFTPGRWNGANLMLR
jgi:hypothetical protein